MNARLKELEEWNNPSLWPSNICGGAADSSLCLASHHEAVAHLNKARALVERLCELPPAGDCGNSGGSACLQESAKTYSHFANRGREACRELETASARLAELKVQNARALADHERTKGRIDATLESALKDSLLNKANPAELRKVGLTQRTNYAASAQLYTIANMLEAQKTLGAFSKELSQFVAEFEGKSDLAGGRGQGMDSSKNDSGGGDRHSSNPGGDGSGLDLNGLAKLAAAGAGLAGAMKGKDGGGAGAQGGEASGSSRAPAKEVARAIASSSLGEVRKDPSKKEEPAKAAEAQKEKIVSPGSGGSVSGIGLDRKKKDNPWAEIAQLAGAAAAKVAGGSASLPLGAAVNPQTAEASPGPAKKEEGSLGSLGSMSLSDSSGGSHSLGGSYSSSAGLPSAPEVSLTNAPETLEGAGSTAETVASSPGEEPAEGETIFQGLHRAYTRALKAGKLASLPEELL